MNTVTLENIRKEFDDIVAVDGINLEVEAGELLVLVGPSGCGKSTTLRMIAGLEAPTSGSVYIDDENVTEVVPQQRELSMVFQNYALYPHKSVKENLLFPLYKMDLTEAEREEKVQWVAELLDITDLLEKDPGQLSGGERQRVALGRTVVREPGLYLMDEPLSNLDAELRVNTRSELRDLQQELGTTTVYVTHDQEEAMSIADRLVVMNDGELQQIGTPRELYQDPTNRFVASFIGEPRMSFLPARSNSGGEITVDIGGDVSLGVSVPRGADVETLGIRPESIFFEDGADPESGELSTPITMDVTTVDPLGHSYEVLLERGEGSLVGLLKQPPEHDSVSVRLLLDKLYLFDAEGDRVEVIR
ncbi:MAG: ABC transporter ATP-binding protein [Halorubrum sp.]